MTRRTGRLKLIGIPPPFKPDSDDDQAAPEQVGGVPGVPRRNPPVQNVGRKNINSQYQKKYQAIDIHRKSVRTVDLRVYTMGAARLTVQPQDNGCRESVMLVREIRAMDQFVSAQSSMLCSVPRSSVSGGCCPRATSARQRFWQGWLSSRAGAWFCLLSLAP